MCISRSFVAQYSRSALAGMILEEGIETKFDFVQKQFSKLYNLNVGTQKITTPFDSWKSNLKFDYVFFQQHFRSQLKHLMSIRSDRQSV